MASAWDLAVSSLRVARGRLRCVKCTDLMMLTATETIMFEVMDYIPAILYELPNVYWNEIDNAIRTVDFKYGVCWLVAF